MSLPPPPVQRSLFDVENLLGRQFDPADRFRLFREKVYPTLLAARVHLESCYCRDNGRPAEEPVVLLALAVSSAERGRRWCSSWSAAPTGSPRSASAITWAGSWRWDWSWRSA